MEYIPTIGLEIHAELKTDSKMFCECPNDPDSKEPNRNVCSVCMGHPGTLPVANSEAIHKVRLVGLALNSTILEYSKFDRKNYFYPDLPKGYQISQYDLPLCSQGSLEIDTDCPGEKKNIRITRVHLEEDTAKLVHANGSEASLVDFNRGGVPLMELVTEPDLENSQQVRRFVEEMQLILRYLGASDADMEKGKMRVEVNISLSQKNDVGVKNLGTKVEIKNLNSLKAVEGAVAYEIQRQKQILENGQEVSQETRGWNEVKCETFSQREKEEAFDYRYFPEPDIPPLTITQNQIDKLKTQIGELPHNKRQRFAEQYGLDSSTVEIFVQNRQLANYFEEVISETEEWVNTEEDDSSNTETQYATIAKICANYLTSDVLGILGGVFERQNFAPTAEHFAEFVGLIYKKEISSKIAKIVLAEMVNNGSRPEDIIAKKGLSQINDEKIIQTVIDEIIAKNQKAASDYKKGKQGAFQFFVGQVLAATQGKANPEVIKRILLDRLG